MKRESLITNTEKLLFDILQESIKQGKQISLIRASLINKKEESFNTDVEEFLTKVEPTEMIFGNKVSEVSEKIENVRKESEIKVNEKANEIKKTYPCKYCGGEHERPLDIANCGKKHKKKG